MREILFRGFHADENGTEIADKAKENGNGRSNAKISDKDIMRILATKGKVKVFSENYKAFSAGKSDIQDNEERLFLCECYDYGNSLTEVAY